MDRLKVLCFAGTYGLALLCELARLVVRSPFRWYLTVGLTSLGWLVQTAFLANLAFKEQSLLPVTTAFESVMVLAWIVALIGIYFMIHWPRNVAVGLFVLPLVLGLVVAAGWFAPGSRTGWKPACWPSGERCMASSCWVARCPPAWRSRPASCTWPRCGV